MVNKDEKAQTYFVICSFDNMLVIAQKIGEKLNNLTMQEIGIIKVLLSFIRKGQSSGGSFFEQLPQLYVLVGSR